MRQTEKQSICHISWLVVPEGVHQSIGQRDGLGRRSFLPITPYIRRKVLGVSILSAIPIIMQNAPLHKSLFGARQLSPCNVSKQDNSPRCKEKSHDVNLDSIKQAISTGDPEVRTMQLRQIRSGSALHEYIVLELDVMIEGRVQSQRFQIEAQPVSRSAFSKNSQEHSSVGTDILKPYSLEQNSADSSECLFELVFHQFLPISRIFKIWKVISKHASHTPHFDSCFYARTLMLCVLCEKGTWYEEYIWVSHKDTAQ
ncbi:unnamed protein product [Rhizoctonia solani]|uniref:Uncharacterized protein n=1 Tax=Rhizoctonia solani TaxID=456999 RepID=A0A8H3H470_9AGAM|nr:unnamed protein product [Rhizoctonia solani]